MLKFSAVYGVSRVLSPFLVPKFCLPRKSTSSKLNIAEENFPEELLRQQETSRLDDPQYDQTRPSSRKKSADVINAPPTPLVSCTVLPPREIPPYQANRQIHSPVCRRIGDKRCVRTGHYLECKQHRGSLHSKTSECVKCWVLL